VPTVLQWSAGGNAVFVTGSFNAWEERIPLRRSGTDHVVCLNLPPGKPALHSGGLNPAPHALPLHPCPACGPGAQGDVCALHKETSPLQVRTSTSLSWTTSGASPRTSRRCATRWVTSTIASPSLTRPCTCTSTRPAASSVTRRTTCTRRCGRPGPAQPPPNPPVGRTTTAAQLPAAQPLSCQPLSRPPLSLAPAATGDSLRLPPPAPPAPLPARPWQALPDEITLAKEPPLAPLQLSCIALNTQPAPDPRIASWTLPTPLSVYQHAKVPLPPPPPPPPAGVGLHSHPCKGQVGGRRDREGSPLRPLHLLKAFGGFWWLSAPRGREAGPT